MPPPPPDVAQARKAQKNKLARARREKKAADAANAPQPQQQPTPAPDTPAPEDNFIETPEPAQPKASDDAPQDRPQPKEGRGKEGRDAEVIQPGWETLHALNSEMETLMTARKSRDAAMEEAEKAYDAATERYKRRLITKGMWEVKARAWEVCLDVKIGAHEAGASKLRELEKEIDKEFMKIATRMLTASESKAKAGSILENFQELSIHGRDGFTKRGDGVKKPEEKEAERHLRIQALADFWVGGLGRKTEEFALLVATLTNKGK